MNKNSTLHALPIFIITLSLLLPSFSNQSEPLYSQADIDYDFNKGVDLIMSGDSINAFIYMKRTAEAGHVGAQNNLGNFYGMGIGAERDLEKALYWITLSAEGGSALAQNSLGCMYKDGFNNVEVDLEKAKYWFEQSALQGEDDAQYNLAIAYRYGQGCLQSYFKSLYWFYEAEKQGYTYATDEINEISRIIIEALSDEEFVNNR